MSKSSIEWTQATWNPCTGCTPVSPSCRNCYAKKQHARLRGFGMAKYARPFEDVGPWPADLDIPLKTKRPTLFFVNSMSNLFHEDLPESYIRRVFEVMAQAAQHTFQVLTKRAARLETLAPCLPWPANVWMGVSVETDKYFWRIDHLRRVPAAVRFLSLEPLLGPMSHVNLDGIHWVIVGGESGPGARPCDPAWVRAIRDRCVAAGVPLFFKQWGKLANNPDQTHPTAKENGGANKGGRMLDGLAWDQMPTAQSTAQSTARLSAAARGASLAAINPAAISASSIGFSIEPQ